MKKLEKMSFAILQGKLTRNEMKNISGGSGGTGGGGGNNYPSNPNYVYGAPGQAMFSQANPNGNPGYPNTLNSPIGGNDANTANELTYFAQAVSNGIQLIGTAINSLLP